MKDHKDPTLEALRRANPATEESTKGWHESAEGKWVAARAQAEDSEPSIASERRDRPMKHHRNRAVIVLIAAVAAAFGIAAAITLGPRETLTPNMTTCHDLLRQKSDSFVVALLEGDPIEACRQGWQGGFHEPAPAFLAVCVLDEGGTGVFPYDPVEMAGAADACSSIGAAEFKPSPAVP